MEAMRQSVTVRPWQTLTVVGPGEGVWQVRASLLPWEPVFCGVFIEAIQTFVAGTDAYLGSRPRIIGPSAEADFVGSLLTGVLLITFGMIEVVLLIVFWPVWWSIRRLSRRPLDLTLVDPGGQWVMVPHDLDGQGINDRREQLAHRIRTGALRPVPPRSEGMDLSCAGPGQPLIRRRRPRHGAGTPAGAVGQERSAVG